MTDALACTLCFPLPETTTLWLPNKQASLDNGGGSSSSSHVAPYSRSYLRTPIKALLLAPDGGKSMVSEASVAAAAAATAWRMRPTVACARAAAACGGQSSARSLHSTGPAWLTQ
jgi:hypothetical protein